ncbi:MAG: YkgJ family cysteine cluster protein [Calditrichaceae bacterium]|nr:YkgJ family cysteine cluster protein [Calditrichaceae bacterium]MBN2709104.1 YkgJ family cysteine cluster protein [Calditrichaceae bacterium]RQV92186.1 MAG: YkgJ family cysteine cluster protein [Calditrichota bacterium]
MKSYLKNIRFECQSDCVNCCRLTGGYVYLTESEAEKIAEFLETSKSNFINWFTRTINDRLCLVDGEEEKCVFLDGSKCSIYEVRPLQCRTYPFWKENIKTYERWKITCSECPGIGKGRIIPYEKIIEISKGKTLDSIK